MKFLRIKYVWLALITVAVFVFLLLQSRRINEELHNQYRSDLRQLEGLHALLNEDVLRVRLGLLVYFDPLNTTLSDLDTVRDHLGQVPAYINEQGRQDIAALLQTYDEFMAQKRSFVEDFNGQNAILKNSLSYFTIVVSDLAGSASGDAIAPELRATLNNLLQDILLYNVSADPELAQAIRADVGRLRALDSQYNPAGAQRVDIDTLVSHTNIILNSKPITDTLIGEMFALPVSEQIAQLSNIYNDYYEAARQTANLYQVALYVFSLVVVGYISITIILRLRKSAAVLSSAKEELQSTYWSLEKRTQELETTNEQLEAATREAREASRLKDEFLAVMSHELRTPLNAIIGFQGILLMAGKLDERATHMIQRAQANAERLLALINDILDISRIESGRLQLAPSDITVAEAADKWRSQMSVLADQKGVTFAVNIDASMPATVYADEDAVTKIVTNLLGNAFKFTEEGGVALDLMRSNGSWVIEVKDSGIGIPAHMQQIIFERFRQVDGSSKRKYGGSGLGLAIVHNLCKAMDGTVAVRSVPGEGSTFTVTLPLSPEGNQR